MRTPSRPSPKQTLRATRYALKRMRGCHDWTQRLQRPLHKPTLEWIVKLPS